jgi:hypothetical protein
MPSLFNILLSPSPKGFSVMNVDRICLNLWRLRGRLNNRQSSVGKTNGLKLELRGRRGAPRTMQRKRIAWSRMLRERQIPGDKLRRTDEIERRSRQRRHM